MFFTLLLDLTVNFASVMGTNSWLNVHNTRFSVSLSSRYQPGHCPLTFHDIAVVVVYCDNCSVATLSFESDVTQTKSLRLRDHYFALKTNIQILVWILVLCQVFNIAGAYQANAAKYRLISNL